MLATAGSTGGVGRRKGRPYSCSYRCSCDCVTVAVFFVSVVIRQQWLWQTVRHHYKPSDELTPSQQFRQAVNGCVRRGL